VAARSGRAAAAGDAGVGFLMPTSVAWWSHLAAAFHQGLGQTGYVEGQNLAIEYR
jgi:putative ABC transport system substrate-binding protein